MCSTPRTRPLIEPQVQLDCYKDIDIVEVNFLFLFLFQSSSSYYYLILQPKIELPEYGSDEDFSPKQEVNQMAGGFLSLDGGMEVLPTYQSSYQSNERQISLMI